MGNDNWQTISLGEYASFVTGKLDSNAATSDGQYPFFTCSRETFRTDTYSFDTECVLLAGNNAAGVFPIKYFEGKFDAYQRTYVIEPLDRSILSTRFLYYALSLQLEYMKSVSTGAATKFLTKTILDSLELAIPGFETQHKIAAILSAYDDLIENNTRRIQILEEMAQAIYHEWFVQFHFPGHENVKMVDSGTELGEVPEGWEVISISDIASIYRGKSYRSHELLDEGGLPFLNLKCVERDGGFRQDGIKRFLGDFKETQSAKPGDIIIALTDMTQERRIIARAARVPDIGENLFVMSMDLVKVISNLELSQSFLYTMLRFSSFPDEVKEFANGVNVLHLSPQFIENYRFPLPPELLSGRFGDLADPIYLQIDNLHRKNNNLLVTRDLLLPRLVSGQIDVSNMDINLEVQDEFPRN